MRNLGIILLNWNGHEDTVECIKSIRMNEQINYPIFILDNDSKCESSSYIENWIQSTYKSTFKILSDTEFEKVEDFFKYSLFFIKGKKNLGFAKGNNFVWKSIKDHFDNVLLLNNDTVIEENAISGMVEYLKNHPNTGVVSCDIRYYRERDNLWNAGGYFTWYGDRKYIHQSKIDQYKSQSVVSIKTPFVTGCALMVRKSVANKIGVLTERFFFGEEDFHYCKKLEQNKILVETVLTSTIYHKVGSSIGRSHHNSQKFVLHFSNRIINLREFYGKVRWSFWKEFYLLAVFLKLYQITKNFKLVLKVIRYIRYYVSNYNEISHQTFMEINRLEI